MNESARRAAIGAVAGVAGTAAMTIPMLLATRLGVLAQPPPKEIARRAAGRTGARRHLTHQEFKVAWLLSHFAYGAAAGSVFGLIGPRVPLNCLLVGAIYGTLLWAAGYLGLMPALGLYPLPRSVSPPVVAVILPDHWIYGVVVAEVIERLRPRVEGPVG
jgi:putative membrane protein